VTQFIAVLWIYNWLIHLAGVPPENYYNAGNRLYAAGNYQAAEHYYRNVFKYPALGAAALYNAGNAEYFQGHWQKAADYFESALRIRPDDEDAWFNLELARRRMEIESGTPAANSAKPGLGAKKRPGRKGEEQQRVENSAADKKAHLDSGEGETVESYSPADIFSLPPEGLADYIRELTKAGYPFRPGSSLVKSTTTRQPDEIDW
jgi:tetratricopeptide (TPR) repeat protein